MKLVAIDKNLKAQKNAPEHVIKKSKRSSERVFKKGCSAQKIERRIRLRLPRQP